MEDEAGSSDSDYFSIIDVLQSNAFSWIFLPHRRRGSWRFILSSILFFLLTFAVPLLSHFLILRCSLCDQNHRRPFDWIVQSSLSLFSTLSFACLSRFTRKYGLRRFLLLDRLGGASDELLRGYSDELHRSMKLLCAFIVPCVLADSVYNIWWFSSGGTQIPYVYNVYLSNAVACTLQIVSWLYRSSLFFLVCIFFKLTCSLQILRLEDFALVFDKLSDVGPILVEHLTIRRNLRIISHRFRVFILSTLILVTASQFVSLLVMTVDGSIVNVSTAGELALCSMTLVTGLFICQRSAAKITHRAQSLTSLVTKWHMCATIGSFVGTGSFHTSLVSDNEVGDAEDVLDNTRVIPVHTHTMSYQKRQALVTYFENCEAGITMYGFMLDRTSINTVFAIQLSLALWLLDKTIGFT